MNSIIQSLCYLQPLIDYVRSIRSFQATDGAFSREFSDLVEDLRSREHDSIPPTIFRVRHNEERFNNLIEHDCHEFHTVLMERFSSESSKAIEQATNGTLLVESTSIIVVIYSYHTNQLLVLVSKSTI